MLSSTVVPSTLALLAGSLTQSIDFIRDNLANVLRYQMLGAVLSSHDASVFDETLKALMRTKSNEFLSKLTHYCGWL